MAQQATTADEWIHRIQPGDTLIGLHARLMRPEADWRVVQRLNRVADPLRLLPGSELRIPLALLRAEPLDAEVLHTHGEVWIERPGATRAPLTDATRLRDGDVLGTGAQSSLSLRFADGTRTQLGPEGRLVLDRHARLGGAGGSVLTRLRLDAGSAEAQVPAVQPAPRFEIRTPVVNLGVRGTEFRGRVDGERTLAEVLRGRVAAGAQSLPAGFGTVATATGVTPPRPLLAAPDLSAVPRRVERVPLQFPLGPSAGAARWRAQIFDASSEPRLLLDGLFDRPQAAWIDDLPDGLYELRVRASDADGVEGQTARLPFTLKARPQAPFLLRPAAEERLLDDGVTLAWTLNAQAVRYRLQVARQPDFVAPMLERDDLTAAEFKVTLPVGRYHWRVASVRADGDAGPWGDARTFERVERPPLPVAPAAQPARAGEQGILLAWEASQVPGVSYQVQVARDAGFTQLVLDERTTRNEQLLAKPDPGTHHVRVRSIGPDGRAGSYGATQIVEVPRSMWWLWLLPLLLLY